jgi:hypothetical protein
MPAQAGIQEDHASAYSYASWIPAFAGMTPPLATTQNSRDEVLERFSVAYDPGARASRPQKNLS